MANDAYLFERIRVLLADDPRVTERKMFGCDAFLLSGNMVCGVIDSDLVARVGADDYERMLGEEDASEFGRPGRPMRGFVLVDGAAIADDEQRLGQWVARCAAFVGTLPAK